MSGILFFIFASCEPLNLNLLTQNTKVGSVKTLPRFLGYGRCKMHPSLENIKSGAYSDALCDLPIKSLYTSNSWDKTHTICHIFDQVCDHNCNKILTCSHKTKWEVHPGSTENPC